MSTVTERFRATDTTDDSTPIFRLLALTGALVLTIAHVQVLYYVSTVIGKGSGQLLFTVVATLVAATVLSRYVRERIALWIAVLLAALGTTFYLTSIPGGLSLLVGATDKLVSDSIALLTGFPIVRIRNVDVWITGYAPAPLFLAWYLALRRRYVPSVAVGGAAMGVFVLTGDAATKTTLVGTLGGLAAIGFGELEQRNGSLAQADVLAVTFALMILFATAVPIVPGGGSNPLFLSRSPGPGQGGPSTTLEASLTSAPGQMQIYGPITLSPEVRFTVFAEESAYWRVGVYDRFTGQSWIRTGDAQPYKGRLGLPPGKSNLVSQHYTMEGAMSVMPAAATPIEVSGPAASKAFVDDHGAFQASRTLKKGETYSIKSAVYDGGLDNLAEADGEDPRSIRTTYTQVPSGISSEFRTRTERVVAPADNRLEAALMVESYLERTKSYSLNTTLPSGNVADAFLLRMREGYCVYFATTMTMMLRSQGIPARYVVGYTPGQQVGDNTWVVRGLNSHAWVEVYFPDVGWVKFDPTPGGPRESAEFSRIEAAREAGNENVDTDRSINAPLTPTPTPTPGEPLDDPNRTAPTPEERFRAIPGYGINGTLNGTFTTVGAGGGGGPSLPSPEDAAFAMVLLLGLAAGAHRYGVTDRVVRTVRLRWQPRRGPDEDAERAFDRLEMLLTQDIRPRRTGETPQEYASTMDTVTKLGSRATRVADIYQKAHYGDGVTRSEADEAIELVDELVHERAPRLGTGLLRS